MNRLEYLASYESLFARRWTRGGPGRREDLVGLAELWRVWRFAALEVAIAFEEWRLAPEQGNDEAYAIYLDSLRREDAAARELADRYGSAPAIEA
jgi:hypothetical protein